MDNENCDKLIFVILQNDSYEDVVEELNEAGFYVTVLRSSGGFLKKPVATLMIGLHHSRLEDALQLLRNHGDHVITEWKSGSSAMGLYQMPFAAPAVPVSVHRGGIVLFVIDVEHFERC